MADEGGACAGGGEASLREPTWQVIAIAGRVGAAETAQTERRWSCSARVVHAAADILRVRERGGERHSHAAAGAYTYGVCPPVACRGCALSAEAGSRVLL